MSALGVGVAVAGLGLVLVLAAVLRRIVRSRDPRKRRWLAGLAVTAALVVALGVVALAEVVLLPRAQSLQIVHSACAYCQLDGDGADISAPSRAQGTLVYVLASVIGVREWQEVTPGMDGVGLGRCRERERPVPRQLRPGDPCYDWCVDLPCMVRR